MGLELVFRAGGDEIGIKLQPSDVDLLSFLREKGLEKEVEAIFDTKDFGKSSPIDRNEALISLKTLIGKINSEPDLIPYTYGAKEEIPRGSGMISSGLGGGISGILIDGELFYLAMGFNECVLYKLKKGDDGKWHEVEPKDVRGLKVIKTDAAYFGGDIFIYREKVPTTLMRNMKQLLAFLEKASVQKVIKVLC